MYAARSQNVVERVAEALKQQQPSFDLPEAIIRSASEKYRLLAVQVRVGSIQLQPASQKDTSERRAAALLEYCTRQHGLKNISDGRNDNSCTPLQLPWSALTAAVQTKSHQPIQQLQHILVNFLQPITLSKTPSRKRTYQVDASKNNQDLENSRSLRDRMHSISYKDGAAASRQGMPAKITLMQSSASDTKYAPKILHELVIRLAGYLDDPHGVLTHTCQLLADIYAYYENDSNFDANGDNADPSRYTNTAERRGHLYDLQRYAAAYEAAALYHIATSKYHNNQESKQEGTDKAIKGRKRQEQEQTRKGKDEALNPDDEDVVQFDPNEEEALDVHYSSKGKKCFAGLHIDDLMDVSNEYTYLEIMQVLPRVQALAKKLKRFENGSQSSNRKRRTKTAVKVLKDGGTLPVDAFTKIENEGSMNLNDEESKRCFDSDPATSFMVWKEGVLSEAKLQVRSDALLEDISDEMAIDISANAILQKYGILPLP